MRKLLCGLTLVLMGTAALLSCEGDDEGVLNAQIPARRVFDDGRELFFSKPDRDVRWLSWAPDGRRFAYLDSAGSSDFKVHVYDVATREDVVVATDAGGRVLWSPNGDYVLYNCDDSYWVVKPAGTGRRKIIAGFGITVDLDAYWSPDGKEIVWSAVRGPGYSRNIYIKDLDGGTPVRFSLDDYSAEYYPLWGPDGEWIAFYKYVLPDWGKFNRGDRCPVVIKNLKTSKVEIVWTDDNFQGVVCMSLCDWSADGRYILLTVVSDPAGAGYWELWVLALKTRRFKQVTCTPRWDRRDYSGKFGPDGMVYFPVFDYTGECFDIWRVDPKL